MKVYKDILNVVLEQIEETVTVTKVNHYDFVVSPIAMTTIIEKTTSAVKCSDEEAYYALHYAAHKGLVDVTWRNDGKGIQTLRDLTPAGHDYLANLRGE